MRARSCSGLRPVCTSICASGSSWRRSSMPSCAIRSAIRMRKCASSITPSYSLLSLLSLKAELAQAHFKFVQCLDQVCFLEEAQVADAENLTFELLLASAKDHAIHLAHLFE